MAGTFIRAAQDDTALDVEAGYNYLRAGEDGIWYDHEGRTVGFGASEVVDSFIGNRTANPASAPNGLVGTLTQWFSWITNRIKAIVGTTNWYDAVPITLTDLTNGIVGISPGLKIESGSISVAAPGGDSGDESASFSFSAAPQIWAMARFNTAAPTTIAFNVSDRTATAATIQWAEIGGLTPNGFTIDWIAIGTP